MTYPSDPAQPRELPAPLRLIAVGVAVYGLVVLGHTVRVLVSGEPELFENQHWRSVMLGVALVLNPAALAVRQKWVQYLLLGLSFVALFVHGLLGR